MMANWKNVGSGALSGAATGAASGALAGSAIPVLGTGIGAVIGGAGGLLAGAIPGLFQKSQKAQERSAQKKLAKQQQKALAMNGGVNAVNRAAGELPNNKTGNAFTGYEPYTQYNSLLSPEQRASQNALLPQVTAKLQNAPNFEDIRNETLRHYKEQVLPGLNESFVARTGGKASSPSLGIQRAEGDRSLITRLNAQRYQHELEQQRLNQNLYSTLSNKSIEPHYYEGVEGTGPRIANELIEEGVPAIVDIFRNWNNSPAQKRTLEQVKKTNPALYQQAVQEFKDIQSGKSSLQNSTALKGLANQELGQQRKSETLKAVGNVAANIAEVGIKALAQYYIGKAF
jgi:hypothetical protein